MKGPSESCHVRVDRKASKQKISEHMLESVNSLPILSSLAIANELLIELQFLFRSNPQIKEARHGFDLRKCGSGCRIDAYAEASVDEDVSYCWWLEMMLQPDKWTVQADLLKDAASGPDVVLRFPERTGSSEDALCLAIVSAGQELSRSAKGFEFPPCL